MLRILGTDAAVRMPSSSVTHSLCTSTRWLGGRFPTLRALRALCAPKKIWRPSQPAYLRCERASERVRQRDTEREREREREGERERERVCALKNTPDSSHPTSVPHERP